MTEASPSALVVPGLPVRPAQTWATTEVDEPSTPVLREGLTPDDVTPGLLGFLVIFGAAVACIPLFRSLTGKLRVVDRRAPADEPDVSDGPDERDGPGERSSPEGFAGAGDDPAEGTDGSGTRGAQVDGVR